MVAAEPVTSVDVTSADTLAELEETLKRPGIELCFAELKDPVKDKLRRFGLFAAVRRGALLCDHRRGGGRLCEALRHRLGRAALTWLIVFVPIAIALEHYAPHFHLGIFIASGLAVLPLAGWMGRATEHLAERVGEGAGGLLNATFGNAAELIIALVSLRAGLYDVVKASIIGSIVGNVLLVLGGAMLAGGLRHKEQKFNAEGARAQATMQTLAAIALVTPAAYHGALGSQAQLGLGRLSVSISVDFAGGLRALSRLQPDH